VSALLTSLALEREASPLHQDAHGVIHVAQTRVTLESVISLLEQGANAEEITLRYDVLNLRDVYATPRLLPRPSAGGASVPGPRASDIARDTSQRRTPFARGADTRASDRIPEPSWCSVCWLTRTSITYRC